jgi:hypothetical protein
MVTDLPDYEKKVVVVTVPGDYPAEMKVDHRKILGEPLKTPTFASSIPTSIENDALAYDPATNRFYVDLAKISATDTLIVSAIDLDIRALTSVDVVTVKSITDALPAGSNAIGKLAANSGVDIGDVDVKSIAAGDNNIGNVDVVTLPTILQSTKHDSKTYKTAVFDASASGNLVAAVADKVIKLHALTIQAQNTVVVNLNNGAAGASLMEWSFQAREGAVIPMATAPAFWAKTGVNTALYVTLSAAVTVTITAIYSDDDAT